MLFFAHSAASAAPAISWAPSFLTETITAGESKTVSISFTAAKNISNSITRVVPELQPYVHVDPSAITRVAKGETVVVNVTFSAPLNSLLGTFQGTIQLRSGGNAKKTFARPLPVELNVEPAPELRNDTLGFQINYPATMVVREVTTNKFLFSGTETSGEADSVAPIQLFVLPLSLEDERNRLHSLLVSDLVEEDLVIDGRVAKRLSGVLDFNVFGWGGRHHTYVLVEGEAGLYKLEVNSEDPIAARIFDEMLSTLRLM